MSDQNPSAEVPRPEPTIGSAPEPQQSFGTAPEGQATMGSAPPAAASDVPGATSVPAATDGPVGPGAPLDAPVAPPKKKGLGVGGIIGLIVLVVVLGAGGWYFFGRTTATNANVGDCLAGTTPAELKADNLKIVKCDDATATFKVVQRVTDTLYNDSEKACTDQKTLYVFWSGKDGDKGTVLCLSGAK